MAGTVFWSGMTKRIASALRLDDKLMIGRQDKSGHEYSDLKDVRNFLNTNKLRKDGYKWEKGAGNQDLDEYEAGDTIEEEGTLWPGYYIKGYIMTAPMTDKNLHIKLIDSIKL